jgi:uncharacterized protein (DUF927 family)
MTDFLTSVLPTQGMYCSVGIKTAIVKQEFVHSVEELEVLATAQYSQDTDAYFALASFNDSSSRKAENALYLRSFYLDIDCGVGKPYRFQAEAAQHLRNFLTVTGLPEPTLVNSGGGLHVYWVINENIPIDIWFRHARSLKALCKEHNLHADATVTTDAARILRVPGTGNFKDRSNVRLVQIISTSIPVALEEFTRHLPAAMVDLSAAKAFGMDDASRELAQGDFPTCNFGRIVSKSVKGSGCAQIKKALLEAATLEEPLWRAALSIAIRCEDGAASIHKLSKAHPGYSAADTEAKAAATKGPHTCDWYRDNYPSTCNGCIHTISGPIMLGKVVAAAVATSAGYQVEVEIAQEGLPMEGESAVSKIKVLVDIPEYPFPYFRGAQGGVFQRIRNKDGDDEEVEVYRNDLYIVRRFFDSDENGDGEGEMALIQLHMDRDGIRQFYSPIANLFSLDKMRDLLIKNGVVAYGKQLTLIMGYFASSIRKLQAQYAANKTRSQMGWTPDLLGFVVGEIEYTAAGARLAPPASSTRQLAPAFTPKGTLEEWSSIANFYNRPGLEPHALALLFGFASPLLKLIGGTAVKGFQVHLKSNASGSGKTTIQTLCNSIFGHPTELLQTQKDTIASKIHTLGMMNSICVTIDEVTNMLDTEISDLAYGVTTGRGRHRMDANSNKLRTNHTTWCNITLTSGNASVVDKLAQLKSTADGELRRILEVEIPKLALVNKAELDAVFTKLNSNYGVAGPLFINYVLQNREEVTHRLLALQRKIDESFKFDQSDRYYSCALTCAFVAGSLCRKLGILNYDINRLYSYAYNLITQAKVQTVASAGNPLLIAQETLSSYINENLNNALVINSASRGMLPPAPDSQHTIRGPLRMRYEPDTQKLFVTVAEFRKFFANKQVDVQESIKLLSEAEIILNHGQSEVKRIGAGALGNMAGLGVRCYVLDGKAIGIDEDAFKQTEPAPA